jgi:hypothetical protein
MCTAREINLQGKRGDEKGIADRGKRVGKDRRKIIRIPHGPSRSNTTCCFASQEWSPQNRSVQDPKFLPRRKNCVINQANGAETPCGPKADSKLPLPLATSLPRPADSRPQSSPRPPEARISNIGTDLYPSNTFNTFGRPSNTLESVTWNGSGQKPAEKALSK